MDFDANLMSQEQRAANDRLIDALNSDRPSLPGFDVLAPEPAQADGTIPEGRHVTLRSVAEVSMERPMFLYDPFIPCGVLTMIAGRAGVSKSTLSIDWAAKATRGLLPGDRQGQPSTVVFTALEDSASMQRARLTAAYADMNRVQLLTMTDTRNGVSVDTAMVIPDDLSEVRDYLKACHASMWIIDPITSCIRGDTNKRDDVRAALDPLAALAKDLNIAIVGILHFNKGGGYASDKVSGSHAFRDAVRSLILVAKDDETGDCIATIDKSSYTMAQGQSYSYGLISYDVTDDHGQTMSVPKVTGFMPTERSVNEVINANQTQGVAGDRKRAERGEVAEWLIDYLQTGPAPFRDVAAAAKENGYTPKQLSNARERTADPWIITVKDVSNTGRGQRRLWALSETAPNTSRQHDDME